MTIKEMEEKADATREVGMITLMTGSTERTRNSTSVMKIISRVSFQKD